MALVFMGKIIFACFAPLREGDEGGLIEAMRPSNRAFEPGSRWTSLGLA
jgi:hypothetical protein